MERIESNLDEVFSYLHGAEVKDACSFGQTCKYIHSFMIHDKSMRNFWYKLLKRTTHKKDCGEKCYDTEFWWYSRSELRQFFGECSKAEHTYYKANTEKDLLHTRNVYREWQAVGYRRFYRRYWGTSKQKRLNKLYIEISTLENSKRFANNLSTIYKNINSEELKKARKK